MRKDFPDGPQPPPYARRMETMTTKFTTASVSLAAIAAAFVAGGMLTGGGDPIVGLPVARAMSAAMGDNSFAVCTVSMDGVSEGFFLLDFETGDLTGGVLNQNSAKFATAYRHNILEDLGFKPGQVKTPRFLMVPGRMSFAGTMGNRLAQSVLYVTDASTGVSVAYGIPWTNQQPAARAAVLKLQPLDVARPRGGVAP